MSVSQARGAIVWLTGLPGAGKTTIADALLQRLAALGLAAYVLDGDRLREGLNNDLGFAGHDRQESVRRAAEVARLFADAGMIAIAALVSPIASDRALARRIAGGVPFVEVHIHAPLAVCEARDPKQLYREARAGRLVGLTGIDARYEAPMDPDAVLDTSVLSVDEAVTRLVGLLVQRGVLASGRR